MFVARMFSKIGVFKNFTGKRLCCSLFLIKLLALACNFIKKRLQHWCFHVKFIKYFKNTFFYRTPPSYFELDIKVNLVSLIQKLTSLENDISQEDRL